MDFVLTYSSPLWMVMAYYIAVVLIATVPLAAFVFCCESATGSENIFLLDTGVRVVTYLSIITFLLPFVVFSAHTGLSSGIPL